MTDRIEVQRTIAAPPSEIFAVLADPQGHAAIDSSGMLQAADGEPVKAVGESFVVHMDRESLHDFPELRRDDGTAETPNLESARLISWTVLAQLRPQIGHVYGYRLEPTDDGTGTVVTSFYDWTDIHPQWREADILPIISENYLRAT